MLKNAPTLAIVAVHTEENEPPRILISNITNIYIHYFIPRRLLRQIRLEVVVLGIGALDERPNLRRIRQPAVEESVLHDPDRRPSLLHAEDGTGCVP